MSENIVIRSRKQPYVGFGILLGPIIIGSVYIALHTGVTSLLEGSAAMSFLLVFLWWHLSTFKLILARDAIIYKELWRSTETPVDMVRSIEPGKLFGVSGAWIIHRRDNASTMLIKVANFSPRDLKGFAQAVVDRNPSIQFTALPIGSRVKSSDRAGGASPHK